MEFTTLKRLNAICASQTDDDTGYVPDPFQILECAATHPYWSRQIYNAIILHLQEVAWRWELNRGERTLSDVWNGAFGELTYSPENPFARLGNRIIHDYLKNVKK